MEKVFTSNADYYAQGACYFVGEGRSTLVFVCSQLISAQAYLPLLKLLAKRYSIVVVELPGSGNAPKSKQRWGFHEYGRHDWLVEYPSEFLRLLKFAER